MSTRRPLGPRSRPLPVGMAASTALAAGALALVLAAVPGPASAAAASTGKVTVKEAKVATYGEILEDQAGLALYYDTANKPPSKWACTSTCLTYWPPLVLPKGQKAPVAGKGVTGLGTIKGPSGVQVTWKGKPLYTYAPDKPGQVTGQGIGKVWYVSQLKAAKSDPPSSGGGW